MYAIRSYYEICNRRGGKGHTEHAEECSKHGGNEHLGTGNKIFHNNTPFKKKLTKHFNKQPQPHNDYQYGNDARCSGIDVGSDTIKHS